MSKTNPNARGFEELYSTIELEFGEDVMPRWRAVRVLIVADHMGGSGRPIHFNPEDC